MSKKQSTAMMLVLLWCAAVVPKPVHAEEDREKGRLTGLIREVRRATADFRDVGSAMAAGYGSTGSCVSGAQEGAMGIHFAKGTLIGDSTLNPQEPELLIYEQKDNRLRLVGVEFLVIADAWHAANPGGAPPVLMGQHFHLVGAPNRYGLPPFYELHVWAWRDNPHGAFVDWNPNVSCAEYVGDEAMLPASHGEP